MKRSVIALAITFGFLCAAAAHAQATARTPSTPSLGDLARKLKAEQKAKDQKPVKVFTNDNLPAAGPNDGVSVAPSPLDLTAKAAEPSSQAAHGEKYFRDKMAKLRQQKDMHERELAVLQQKLGQNDVQYYPDPNKTLQQEYTRSDINAKVDDINKKKDQIAADDKAISDLEDELRRDGGDPGWIR